MKRSDIHIARNHSFDIHDRSFKSLKAMASDLDSTVSICTSLCSRKRQPNKSIREKLGITDPDIFIHAGKTHSYEVHTESFSSLTKAADFFDLGMDYCGQLFRGEILITDNMLITLGIYHMIEN